MKSPSFLFAKKPGIALGLAGLLALQGLALDAGNAYAGHAPVSSMAKTNALAAKSKLAVSAGIQQPAGSSDLALQVGMTLNGDGSTCGTATSLVANVGDSIDFCYTVTNNSATAMAYSTLDDSVDGNIFTNQPTAIAAGGSYVYHRNVVATQSQTHAATWTSRDLLPGYTPNDTGPSAFVDVSASGTALGFAASSGDDEIVGVTMPFSFSFYGASSDQLCVSNNGLIFFGVGDPCPTGGSTIPWFGNAELPAASLPNPAILPYWDDFGNGPGDVFYATQGTAPSRKFIVQWNNIQHYSSSPHGAVFEVIFDEAASTIAFEYSIASFGTATYDNGLSATVGLQSDASLANQYSFNTASLSDGKSIVWTSGTATVLTASASTDLDVGAPVIGVTPASIEGSASSGSTTPVTDTLVIANTGDRDLDWSIGEAPGDAQAHFPRSARHVVHKFDPFASAKIDPASLEATAKLRALGAMNRGIGPLGTSGVPAYAFGGWTHSGDYLSIDMAAPSAFDVIASGAPSVYAASFVDNDFSKEYVIDDGGSFGTIDTATGVITTIGPVTGASAGTFLSMRWDSSNGKLYALGDDAHLYTINKDTGAAADVAAISGPDLNPSALIVNFAISPDGLMYGIDIADDVLLAIDKDTGSASVIGPTGINANYAQGMDFDPSTGILYWAGYQGSGVSNIYTVDLTTGAATAIGPVYDGAELFGLAIAIPSGACSQPQDVPWLSVSPATGTTEPGDSSNVTVTMNPSGLSDGFYAANVCVASNDPAHRTTSVPVEFTVGNVAPAATVDPTSLAFSVEAGQGDSASLGVSNTGTVGSHLTFMVTEAESDCASPSDVGWLSASPTSGNVSVGSPATIDVAVDSSSLDVGTQSAVLCLATNDPAQATISVPVTLTVTPTDLIFKDGFDGAGNPNVYDSGVINLSVPNTFDGIYINWSDGSTCTDGSCGGNFNPYMLIPSQGGNNDLRFFWPNASGGNEGGVGDGDLVYSVLHSGDEIGPDSSFTIAGGSGDTTAWMAGVTDGYLGFKFECDVGVCYGYAKLTTTAPLGFPATIVEYWYDMTGAAITIP